MIWVVLFFVLVILVYLRLAFVQIFNRFVVLTSDVGELRREIAKLIADQRAVKNQLIAQRRAARKHGDI